MTCFLESVLFLTCLSLSFAQGFPVEQYYVNNNGQTFLRSFQEDPVFYYPNDINKPIFVPELGLSPQYHDLVYDYVRDFAGSEQPAHVETVHPNIYYNKDQFYNFGYLPADQQSGSGSIGVTDKVNVQNDNKVSPPLNTRVTDKPGLKKYLLPSDLFSLPNHPNNKAFRRIDSIKTKKVSPMAQPTSLPPLGGVISNYVLNRQHYSAQDLFNTPDQVKLSDANHLKRELPDDSDSIVVEAEPLQNTKNSEEPAEHKQNDPVPLQDDKPAKSDTPSIAQSKPAAIALVGPGGIAQASPLGTAVVGQGGLAVAAPSGTAVAGPAGQGALPLVIGEGSQTTKEKNEEADSY